MGFWSVGPSVCPQNIFKSFEREVVCETNRFETCFGTFWGRNLAILRVKVRLRTVLGSTHVVEQLLFSLVLSILMFDFDLIFWAVFYFFGP